MTNCTRCKDPKCFIQPLSYAIFRLQNNVTRIEYMSRSYRLHTNYEVQSPYKYIQLPNIRICIISSLFNNLAFYSAMLC